MKRSDSFKTIKKSAEGLFKEKGSKFIARAYAVKDIEECKERLNELKKEFHDARHHCYAYRFGPENETVRANDDGEPSGSAGKPILNQIYSFELFNVLVVVIRYFGGTRLGVSGLINAYKTSTRDALENAGAIEMYLMNRYVLSFNYPVMNDVMRILKDDKPDILSQNFKEDCVIKIAVKKNDAQKLVSRLQKIRKLDIKTL